MILCANPLAQYQSHADEILVAVRRALEGGNYILGPEVAAFESAFASYCGVGHAVGLNSGTDALTLALRAFGVGPGDEVITVSHTALATVAAVIAAGATPVLVDVEPTFYTMDPDGLRSAITARTKAVVPVHVYGQCADLDAITSIAREHGLPVIEDCAQAAGARHRSSRVGSVGDAGCFSFYPTKNLGAIGDGGMVVTRDAKIAERVRRLRQYGWDQSRSTEEPGINSRLDELQAAILSVKLKYLDEDNDRRRAVAGMYDGALPRQQLTLPEVRPETSHVYHLYVVVCRGNRNYVLKRLGRAGVAAGIHYPVPAHLSRGYDRLCRIPVAGLPVTERLAGEVVSLPMYPELTPAQVQQVTAVISNDPRTVRKPQVS